MKTATMKQMESIMTKISYFNIIIILISFSACRNPEKLEKVIFRNVKNEISDKNKVVSNKNNNSPVEFNCLASNIFDIGEKWDYLYVFGGMDHSKSVYDTIKVYDKDEFSLNDN